MNHQPWDNGSIDGDPFAAAEIMLTAQEQLTREHFPEMYA